MGSGMLEVGWEVGGRMMDVGWGKKEVGMCCRILPAVSDP